MDSLLRKYCEKRKIVLRKGENFHILLTLAWNRVLLFKLKLHKWLHGIKKPIVHYYAVCWNEEKMLPFMFQYYDQFVDHYTIYDNYSDDNSESIIRSHKNADIKKFSMEGGINDYIYQEIKNNCWKCSRGKADWVIVCDIDELVYCGDIEQMLSALKYEGYSIVKPIGFNMYSEHYPQFSFTRPITEIIKTGVRNDMMDKCVLFNPYAIVEINYKPGAHECHPWGRVKKYHSDDVKMLHYKNIGLEQLLERTRSYAVRLSKENIENNYGAEYLKKEQLIIKEFTENEQKASVII